MTQTQQSPKKIYLWVDVPEPIPTPMDLLTDVVYYFPMQGDIKDYSGNNADLTVSYGSASNITYGTNYNTLNGVVLRNSELTYTGTNQTIGIRCNVTNNVSEFFSAGYDGLQSGWGMGVGKTYAQVVSSGSAYYSSNYSIVGGWHFIVVTFDGVTDKCAKLYIDGSYVTDFATNKSSVRSTKGISIGRFGYSNTYYYGDIGITFLTNYTESASTIAQFYEGTKGLYGLS